MKLYPHCRLMCSSILCEALRRLSFLCPSHQPNLGFRVPWETEWKRFVKCSCLFSCWFTSMNPPGADHCAAFFALSRYQLTKKYRSEHNYTIQSPELIRNFPSRISNSAMSTNVHDFNRKRNSQTLLLFEADRGRSLCRRIQTHFH